MTFEDDINQYSIKRIDYEISGMHRIKDRATTLFGFCIAILTGFSGLAIFYQGNDQLDSLYPYFLVGLVLVIITMLILYFVIIANAKQYFLEPKKLWKIYEKQDYGITKGVIRETMFYMIDEMDKKNERLAMATRACYILFPIGPIVIFIPFLALMLTS